MPRGNVHLRKTGLAQQARGRIRVCQPERSWGQRIGRRQLYVLGDNGARAAHPDIVLRRGPHHEICAASIDQQRPQMREGSLWIGEEHHAEPRDQPVERRAFGHERCGIARAEAHIANPCCLGAAGRFVHQHRGDVDPVYAAARGDQMSGQTRGPAPAAPDVGNVLPVL